MDEDVLNKMFKAILPELEECEEEYVKFFAEEVKKHGPEIALMCYSKVLIGIFRVLKDNENAKMICRVLGQRMMKELKELEEDKSGEESEQFTKDFFDVFG